MPKYKRFKVVGCRENISGPHPQSICLNAPHGRTATSQLDLAMPLSCLPTTCFLALRMNMMLPWSLDSFLLLPARCNHCLSKPQPIATAAPNAGAHGPMRPWRGRGWTPNPRTRSHMPCSRDKPCRLAITTWTSAVGLCERISMLSRVMLA